VFFVVGIIIWVVLSFACWFRMYRSQVRYVRLYREARPEEQVPDPIYPEYQWEFFRFDETARKRWRMLFSRQGDPGLEEARRRFTFWVKLLFAVGWGGVVFPVFGGVLDVYLAG
jgi:hypothetical protein